MDILLAAPILCLFYPIVSFPWPQRLAIIGVVGRCGSDHEIPEVIWWQKLEGKANNNCWMWSDHQGSCLYSFPMEGLENLGAWKNAIPSHKFGWHIVKSVSVVPGVTNNSEYGSFFSYPWIFPECLVASRERQELCAMMSLAPQPGVKVCEKLVHLGIKSQLMFCF